MKAGLTNLLSDKLKKEREAKGKFSNEREMVCEIGSTVPKRVSSQATEVTVVRVVGKQDTSHRIATRAAGNTTYSPVTAGFISYFAHTLIIMEIVLARVAQSTPLIPSSSFWQLPAKPTALPHVTGREAASAPATKALRRPP